MKLQERFEADKLELSYADLHHEITKPDSKSPNLFDLPSYLEKGKSGNNKERAFHVGVLDWGRLEKWQQHSNKQPIVMHHRICPVSTSSISACSPFSTEGSSSNDTTASCFKDKTEIQECNTRFVREKNVLLQPPTVYQPPNLRQEEPSKKRDDTTATESCFKDKTEIQECNKRVVQEKIVLLQPPTVHQPPNLRQVEPSKKRDDQTATTSCSKDKTEIQECNKRVVREKNVLLQPPTVHQPPNLRQMEPSKKRDDTTATATKSCFKNKTEIQECNKRVVQEKIVLLQPPTVHQPLPLRREEPNKKRDDTTATESCFKDKTEIRECNMGFVREKIVLLQPPTVHQPPPLRQEEPSKKRDDTTATTSCSRDKTEIQECNKRVVQEKVVLLQPSTVHQPLSLCQEESSKKRDDTSHTTASCSKDKTEVQECNKRVIQEKVVFLQPDGNTKPRPTSVKSFPIIPRSCQLPRARAAISPCRETKSSNVQPKNIEKARSTSPFRHLGRIVKSYSSKEKSNSIPGPSCDSDKVKSRSSPLRRLLDPILKPKTDETCKKKISVSGDEDQRPSRGIRSTKVKLDPSSTVQALLRVAYKNGLPLFTFAVESDGDILAATVKNSEKGSIFTFFTIRETKKKSSSSWMSHSSKTRQDYVPNVVAQMNVSDTCSSDVWLREFVMFSVDTTRDLDYHPNDELAAIVTQMDRDFATTVILPCGVHSLPSKGEPYSLVQRWKSGGSCDCGGWDPGCRYEILSGHHKSGLRSSSAMDQFSLFHQGDSKEKPRFVLAPFKDGIYSVEFDPSISVLQAFSTCIAVLDSRKMMDSSEGCGGDSLSEPKSSSHIHNVSNPPFSPVGRV